MKIGSYEIQVPFVTTSSDKVKIIRELASPKPGQKAIDLGSGDGRIIIELARSGIETYGFEFNAALVEKAKRKIVDAKLESLAHAVVKDFWKENLGGFDIIYIYGMKSIMGRLQEKLQHEMKPEAKFISN